MAQIWYSQIDRQIDIKIIYPETNRLNGKDMVFSDSQIDRQVDRYQNWISRDKQIEWHRYGTLIQIDRQIDIKIGYPETNRLNGIDMVLSDRQIDRYQNQMSRDKQLEWQRYGVLRQSDRQIDRYQNWLSRDKQIEWHRYGTLRQIDRQIDIKIRYPETNRLKGKDMVFSDSQIDRQIDRYQNWISREIQIEWHRYGTLRQIDRQISKLDIQRQTD